MGKKATKDAKDLLATARKRYKAAADADSPNRRLAMDDLKFVHEPGAQWDETLKQERGARPCYEFNKLRVTVKRIVNDIRANRPQGKVRAVEDGDKDTSQVLEGLVRNIWNVSDADAAVDNAAEYQVAAGMGAWRIVTDYSSDTAWEQDILIKPIRNPFCVYPDPAAVDPMKRDARYWFVTSKMAKEVFESKYGDVPVVEFEESEFDDEEDWTDEESVRIAEYWYKKPVTKTLYLLQDGATVEEVPEGQMPLRSRQVQTHQICMCVMSGDKVLEGPTEWAGSHFPFVVVYGEHVVLDGKSKWWGLARHAKDAQRAYNFSRTLAVESIAHTPQAKYWVTPKQAEGNTDAWARAHKENFPFLLFNPDEQNPGPPQRMGGADVPVALVQEMQISSEDIKAVTGIYDASLGQKSNEQSGIAIRARQAQGEIATFNYSDNIARGIRRTWEILVDLIPKVYDTERSIRILGTDGAESYAKVNALNPMTGEVENDLSRGKFDVTITTGPSFSTQRQEAAEVYMQFAQANPAVFGVAGDLIFKSLDLPYAEDMADRMRTLLPPPVQQMLQAKEQNNGKALPPEALQAMMQADQAMQMVQMQQQELQQAAQEVEQGKLEAERAKAEVQKMIADLKVQEANLKALEANLQAEVAQAKADLAGQAAQVESQGKDVAHAGERLAAEAQMAGQQSAADLVQQALQVVSQQIAELGARLQQQQQPIVVPVGGGQRRIQMRKVNGGYEADVTEG